MTELSNLQIFRNVIVETLDVAPEQVTDELSADNAAKWDSLAHLQIILALEGEYRVQLDLERAPELTSVYLLKRELEDKGVSFGSSATL